ncbi:MAG TPA: serine hydrolase domain-containing protein [Reyranella sp.]|jgi:CubicO group peptidase (beta-lactamase class C family)|nr:serine hydrolase domain-containing protein [Reyranella sp.]
MAKPVDSLQLERRVDALFAKYTRPGSPGAIVGVARGGHVELVKGYGLASIELGVPISEKTRFRIASVSKQFTVTAALMLAHEGKLKLSDPPHKYIKELAPLPVTIDQMMRNSSGLPDFLELLRLGGHGLHVPARAVDLFAACVRNRHLNFTPGSRFLYSNTNFLLLGVIIERLAKQKLGDFMAERIFKPLGMNHTMLAHEIDTIIPDLATGYLGDHETGFRRAGHAYPQGGEGGLTSSVEDLLIWSRHYDRPTLVPNDLPRQLAEEKPLNDGHVNHYRRGVVAGPLRGLPTIGHGGLWPGYRTEFLRVPGVDLTVVVIANVASLNPWRLARAVAVEALAGTKAMAAAVPDATQAEIKTIAGTWFNAEEPGLFELAWKNNEPTVTQNGMPFALAKRADGWLAAEAGALEFALKPLRAGAVRVDLGAGRIVTYKKLGRRKAPPAAIEGTYVSADSGAVWHVRRGGKDFTIGVSGPLVSSGAAWTVNGIDGDTIEVVSPGGGWIVPTQLASIERDRSGKIVALIVSTGRIKKMRFDRVN